MLESEQFELYGQILSGDESEVELAQLARVKYLKTGPGKLRDRLSHGIGDTPDNVADITRTIIACHAVNRGIITSPSIIARLDAVIASMLEGYGGEEAIIFAIEGNNALLLAATSDYFRAKAEIMASTDPEEIRMIDLSDNPGAVDL